MNWKDVGDWIKANAGSGAALVGSLLTGNVPGAVAAGVAMVSSATGHPDPENALAALQSDPQTLVKLKELANQNEASIRDHIEKMAALSLQDAQAEQQQTQLTIRAGDNSQDAFVRRTRPAQSWVSLFAALGYVFSASPINLTVLEWLLALPLAYAGLRQIGKGLDSFNQAAVLKGK